MHRIHSLDYLKTLLALLVVLGHTNWIQSHMNTGLFVLGNGLMRMIVPLFCMIAGYFLQVAITRDKAGKWLWRVLALYLFWMAVYLPIWRGQVVDLRALATTLLWGFFHLWFLVGLLFGGLAVIVLHRIGHRLAPAHAAWFILLPAAICGTLGVAMQYADLTGLAHISVQRYRNGLFMCFPFVAAGYLIRARIETLGRRALPPRPLAAGLAALGVAMLMAEAWLVQARLGQGVMIEVPLATYVAVPGLFLLALQVEMPPQPVDLGLVSAGIYFLHIWAFHLADFLGVHRLPGLMLIGAGLPALIALAYGAAVSALRRRRGRKPAEGPAGAAAKPARAVSPRATGGIEP